MGSQRDGDTEAQRGHTPAGVGTGTRLSPVKVCLGLKRKRLERSGRHVSPQSGPYLPAREAEEAGALLSERAGSFV